MSLMSERRSMYSLRSARASSGRIIPQSLRTTISRGTVLARRPGVSMRSRPGVSMGTRPTISASGRPGINIRSFIPTAPLPARPGGGLPTPSDTGGALGLGDIPGDIKAFGGNIADQFKTFIPIAIKIIAAVVILKIVLWLIRGRRR